MGSGTDPGEGAALAGALLDKLADTAGLTYATTHHAQLKDRPVSPLSCMLACCEWFVGLISPCAVLLACPSVISHQISEVRVFKTLRNI